VPGPRRRFRITHPFHPWRGREFEVVDVRRWCGDDWLYYYDDEGVLLGVREGWTDLCEHDPFLEISDGRALFRVTDLSRLALLIDEAERA